MFENVKLFDCQKMPHVVRESFFDATDDVPNDVYAGWTLGEYAAQVASEPEYYTDDDAICAANIDAWLMENGAAMGEFVIISHWW